MNKTVEFAMEQATTADTEEILSLLVKTAQWFQKNGSTQWSGLLEGVDTHRTAERIVEGDVFVSRQEGGIAGTVMLLQNPSEWDQTLWEAYGLPNDVIYLHRIAINRDFANKGLGANILKWAHETIQFEGKKKIRLDCIAENEFLNVFYKNAGFTYIGEYDGYSLYEIEIKEKEC